MRLSIWSSQSAPVPTAGMWSQTSIIRDRCKWEMHNSATCKSSMLLCRHTLYTPSFFWFQLWRCFCFEPMNPAHFSRSYQLHKSFFFNSSVQLQSFIHETYITSDHVWTILVESYLICIFIVIFFGSVVPTLQAFSSDFLITEKKSRAYNVHKCCII